MRVSGMRPGQRGRLAYLCLPAPLRDRLGRLGFTRGTPLLLLRRAGGCAVVRVRGVRYALGREIAEGLLLEEERQ